MTSPGEIALRLQDQGWRGLLPLLPHDAAPHIRLTPEKAAAVASGRGKAPGRWARAGWSLLPDWRSHPDDVETIEGWVRWPGVNVGLRACHTAPWVAFTDVDVLHAAAAGELMEMLRRRLDGLGEFIWRIGQAPKFLIPVQVTEPVTRSRSSVIEIDGQRHMIEVLGQGQQAVIAGIHPKTGRIYVWPAGGLDETEPSRLPLLTPAELTELVAACSKLLLRYGPPVGRKGRSLNAQGNGQPKLLHELRARDQALAKAASEFVINTDWSRDDFVAWAYALRGAFGDAGKPIWIRFAAQSVKATNPATAEKVWRDATQAERDGHLRAGAGAIIAIAKEEGWTPPPSPGLPPYFDGAELDPDQARADLRVAVVTWVEQGLNYAGKGRAPRDAIAGAVGLGKTTVTLEVLAQMAQGVTVHYYSPTLELAEEIVAKAKALGLDAVLVRGREESKKDPVRWPALCQKSDVAAKLASVGRQIWESLCYKKDEFGNVTTCEFFYTTCQYVLQLRDLEGKLVVLAHEYLTLPKAQIAKPALTVVDERFHATLIRTPSMPLERVTSHRPYCYGKVTADAVDALAADAGTAIRAVEAGKTMAAVGLTPERLRRMARTEEALAEPPAIWPGMPYAEQQRCAKRLQEIEAFGLARLWRTLAQDHDRVSQRVVVARGIEWRSELANRVFTYTAKAPTIPKGQLAVENMARSLFGGDTERLLLTGEFVYQMRGHRMKDATRTAVGVQVHPDLRVQALVEQIREREVEQMVGRLRLPHRTTPARVFLLSNLPTSLLVDRLAPWAEVIPGKLERAIVAGRGVLPLSYFELARVDPSLWATAEDVRNSFRKGGSIPLRESYWNLTTLSVVTLVSYRRLGHRRGSPHQALLPGGVECTELAEELLAAVVGEVEQISILDVILRSGGFEAAPDVMPEPFVIPGLRTIGKSADGLSPSNDLLIRIVSPWPGSPSLGAAA